MSDTLLHAPSVCSCFSSLSHPTSIKPINLINVPHPETNQAFSFQSRGQSSPLSPSLLRKTRWHFVKSQCQDGSPPWSCDHLKVISWERFSPVLLRACYFCSWKVKGFQIPGILCEDVIVFVTGMTTFLRLINKKVGSKIFRFVLYKNMYYKKFLNFFKQTNKLAKMLHVNRSKTQVIIY